MGASPPANESNDSMPYFSLSAPSIPGDPVGGNGFVISRAGAVATLWHGLPEVVARSPDVVARSPGGYGTVSRRCGTVSRRLWHGLPEVVARSPGGCGTVSRRLWHGLPTVPRPRPQVSLPDGPLSATSSPFPTGLVRNRPRAAPAPATIPGDLRSDRWHGRETMPQQGPQVSLRRCSSAALWHGLPTVPLPASSPCDRT
jgi:hypothetical protein